MLMLRLRLRLRLIFKMMLMLMMMMITGFGSTGRHRRRRAIACNRVHTPPSRVERTGATEHAIARDRRNETENESTRSAIERRTTTLKHHTANRDPSLAPSSEP